MAPFICSPPSLSRYDRASLERRERGEFVYFLLSADPRLNNPQI